MLTTFQEARVRQDQQPVARGFGRHHLRRRGYRCHSHYRGTSRLDRDNGPKSAERAMVADGALVLLLGLAVAVLGSEPLGAFLMIGALAKLFSDASAYQASEARLRQMVDARFENEYFVEQFRQRQS